jgi:hypothetical protein
MYVDYVLGIMVGMWAPEPPQEPYNENLSTSEAGVIVIEQDSSDSEDDSPGYDGYQLLAQAPHDLPSSGNEDTDVSGWEQWFLVMYCKRIINFKN